MFIKKLARALTALAVLSAISPPALADSYPSKPITILIGFGAGGATDTVARLYSQRLSQVLGSSVIVENKPGANQLPAIRTLQAARPDGYTLMISGGSGLSQGPAVRTDLGYDPLRDFTLIGLIGSQPGLLVVGNAVPGKNVSDFIAYAKAHEGQLNYTSAGVGSAGHLESLYFAHLAGLQMAHIPYKSDADTSRELVAGSVQMGVLTAQFAIPLIKSGQVKGLLITTATRQPYLPDVPGLSEVNVSGIRDLDPYTYFGVIGPVGLPQEVVSRLSDAMNKIAAMPDFVSQMRATLYIDPVATSPASFRAFVEKELNKWREVRKVTNLKLEN
jgi:tripartite-type tricarboxylate transporter receptor subunit TctC